ncbi:MAG TPA: DUF2092 domain-containing protein [Solirubrobacteraceae bacterium]|jgi:outer membrane lipoprotein-sorting protein|nr:DUF2092 domain-containing protein [Solirubrobacteraceae bacterium]
MSYFLRRLPLSRLLLLCAVLVGVGAGATALATALGVGPTPPAKPLADAVHDALTASPVEGVSAQIQYTNRLLEGANLASGGGEASQLSSSPLLSSASGRLWISKDGRLRLELQSEKGDTQVYYDGHTLSVYDASSNTLYRVQPPKAEGGSGGPGEGGSGEGTSGLGASGSGAGEGGTGTWGGWSGTGDHHREVPSVAKIEEGIAHLEKHADVSGATPTDVAGQPAYTVRVSPKESGSLLAGAELSWDANHGVPLRAAVYSTESAAPVIELAATSISYGPVEPSVFEFTPPANAKVEEAVLPKPGEHQGSSAQGGEHEHPKLTTDGHGPGTIAVLEAKSGHAPGTAGSGSSPQLPEGLQQVKVNGATASELTTELGTLLTFERAGVRYLVAGALTPSAVEAVAKEL